MRQFRKPYVDSALCPPSLQPEPEPECNASDTLVDPSMRSGNLDALRAIAATMVLLGHAYHLSGRVVIILAGGSLPSQRWFIDTLIVSGYSGVWLFFALSGYLISRPFVRALVAGGDLPPAIPYAIRRVARIYPLYWIALGTMIAVLGTRFVQDGYLLVHALLLQNLFPGQEAAGIGAAWTLSLEVLFYVTVPVVALTASRLAGRRPIPAARLAGAVVLIWGASIAFGQLAGFTSDPVRQGWLRLSLPATLCMFCPGILLAIAEQGLDGSRFRRWIIEWPRARWSAVAAAVGFAVASAITAGVRPGVEGADQAYFAANSVARLLYAVSFGIVVSRAIAARPWGGRWRALVVEVGLISYGIYLIHYVVAQLLTRTPTGRDLIPLPHGGAIAYLVHAGMLLAITLPLAWISWHGVERPILERAIAAAHRIVLRTPRATSRSHVP